MLQPEDTDWLNGYKNKTHICAGYKISTSDLKTHELQCVPQILQARLQQYVNRELPDAQAGFRKGRGIRDQIANRS